MFNLKKKKVLAPQKPPQKAGFDNPLSDPADDKLGRRKLINQIYPYLTNLEPNWSVRVGLLAQWGEGKTTICKWIAQQAIKDGHIPVWFSPWSARTDAQLWVGFYSALIQALKEFDTEFETSFVSLANLKHRTSSLANQEWAQDIGQLHQFGQSGISVVQKLTKMSPQDIQRLHEKVGNKRFIVILDDLDRVDPTLIPQLLMTIRDVLDLGGFSFLLPFDLKIVADALGAKNNSEGFGEEFLGKILDFRVHLEKPSKEQLASFFKEEMNAHCSFVTVAALEGLEDYLPSNPRKLKSLIRGLRIFDSEANRHRDGEIDWKALIFAQMIKQESAPFFDVYAVSTFGDNTDDYSGDNPWISAAVEQDKDKAAQDEQVRINSLLDKVGITVATKRERLLSLCEGWRESYGVYGQHKITYALKLLSQPEALTWAEFDSFLKVWNEKKDFSSLILWFSEHAKTTQQPLVNVVKETLLTLSQQYDLHLERASSVLLSVEQAKCVKQAEDILRLYECYLEQEVPGAPYTSILSAAVFEKLLGSIVKWFLFRGNAADLALRATEETLLKKWVQKAQDNGLGKDYNVLLAGLDNKRFGDEGEIGKLYQDLLGIVDAGMEEVALRALADEGGINAIYAGGVNEGVKKALLDINSGIWKPIGTSKAEQILSTASTNSIVQANARNFLDLLHRASNRGVWEMTREEVCEFYKHPQLVVAVWNAAIATELQFRHLKETRDVRDYLIGKGIADNQLATPDWLLAERKKPVQQNPAKPQPPKSN